MYSLFWKIFFTYWLTILTIELFTAWFTADLSENEIHPILEQQNAEFVTSSTQAVSILTSQGLPELHLWLQHKDNLKAVDEIYVINKHREEINNKPLPDNVMAILANDYGKQILVDHYQPVKHTLSFKTTTPDGEDYLLISTFKHPTLVKYLLAPQRVVLSVFISGLICFFLARYFTSPLAKLRCSTQMLTKGEFDTTALQHLRNRSDEFGALAVDFENMTVRLSDLLNSKRQLLRDISHELRSPLARIRVALGLTRIKYQFTNTDELDRIEGEIARLESLINELLTFVRIRSSAKPPSTICVNIRELLDLIVSDAQYEQQQARGKNSIKLHCPHSIEVKGDAQLLHRAIENIVRNACYYSPDNTVIHIRCTLTTENVRIAIEDFGPGVPNDMLEKIFQPFVRVSSARETDTGGSGIGLAIAKQVIEIHSGSIMAINKTDSNGLIVAITLPIHRESSQRSAA